ncbi:MAG: phosphatase PAP2 family protein [Pseudonocardiaceae bacterium]
MSAGLAVGVLLVVVLGAIVVTGLIARWVVGHPERIRAALVWAADRPALSWVRSHYPRQWRFVGRRFAPGEAVGLALTLGVAAVLTLGVVFGQLLENVFESDGITVADSPVLRFLAAHRQPWSVSAAQVISDLGSPLGAAVTAVVVGVVLAVLRRSWLPLLVLVVAAGGIGLINMVVKLLVSRSRPPEEVAVLGEHGFSFPSGHTVGTTVVWLLSAWLISHVLIDRRLINRLAVRIAVWTIALLIVVAVGMTRVFLGVHFPSDVLAGWALGAAWAVTIALVVKIGEQSDLISSRFRESRGRTASR